MNCAPIRCAGHAPRGGRSRLFRHGFTLLEMCLVLFILVLMFGLSLPAIQSAFVEEAVRKDSHQLALMVRTAMIQTAEQNRPYVIDLSSTTMALHPQDTTAADAGDDDSDTSTTNSASFADAGGSSINDSGSNANGTPSVDENGVLQKMKPVDIEVTTKLDPPNQLMVPDPNKADKWIPLPDNTEWVFQPGELCPATQVRLARGDAWIQFSFSALTGGVEDETSSIP